MGLLLSFLSHKRDTENVPLKEDIQTYFEREVLPFASDAWIDQKKSKVGLFVWDCYFRFSRTKPI